jgi:dolichol-phosphate mannosyltransferase
MTTTVDFPTIDFPPAVEDESVLPVATAVPLPLRHRVRHGVRHPGNWLQLIRFGVVGASGYLINLAVFAVSVHLAGIDYRVASVVAWLVSVVSNFWLNRHWTFDAGEHHPGQQGLRFFIVSLVAFGFTELVLIGLVEGSGVEKVIAQAIAVGASMPLNFLGQKLWSFKV